MRAALLASVTCLLTALPLAAADLAETPGPEHGTDLPPIYLGTQSSAPNALAEGDIPRLHLVWRALTGALRDSAAEAAPESLPPEARPSFLFQW
jgi:hypothetical protein